MKRLLLLAIICPGIHSFAQQTAPAQTTAQCMTNWRNGEAHTYTITHEKSITGSGRDSRDRFTYEASITVLDSTDRDYTIKWVFHIPASERTGRIGLIDSLPYFEGMQMIYRITPVGAFISLENWEEVRDSYTKLMELSLPKKMDSAAAAALERAKGLFTSKELVESALIKEIQLFHTPYGYEFSTKETTTDTKIGNPFGGDPLPALQTFRITDLSAVRDRFTLVISQHIDKGKAGPVFDAIFRRLNFTDSAQLKAVKEQMASFELTDYSEYQFITSSGWPSQVIYTRKAVNGPVIQTDGYTISLLQ